MSVSIDTIVSEFKKSGVAKPNFYKIEIFDYAKVATQDITFYAKATTTPTFSIKEMQVPYMGRMLKLPLTSRLYEDWTVTFIADENYNNRKFFEKWHSDINDHLNNSLNVSLQTYILSNINVILLNHNSTAAFSTEIHNFILEKAFPKEIGPINLGYDQNNTVSEFTVTFAYNNLNLPSI